MKNKPLISIITVVYNGEKFLEKTIQSVINQTYKNIEYIIIDGGSTDATVDIIKKYEEYISYWVSEKDAGIYDAMNKGIQIAKGEWLNFMNAGDSFYDDGIVSFVANITNDSTTLIYGLDQLIDGKHKKIRNMRPLKTAYIGMPFSHQSMFVRKRFHEKNLYNLKYKICSDYDFVCNMEKKHVKYQMFNKVFVNCSSGGISDVYSYKALRETISIALKHYPEPIVYFIHYKVLLIANIKRIIKYILSDHLIYKIRQWKF